MEEKYYLDPKVLTAVEISALKVRVFGKKMTKTSRKTSRKPHAETTKDPRFNVSP
jgi:hypothetical protein